LVRIGFRALCSRVNCYVGIINLYLWRLNSRLLISFMYVVHFSLIALHKWKGICVEASKASFSSSVLLVCKWRLGEFTPCQVEHHVRTKFATPILHAIDNFKHYNFFFYIYITIDNIFCIWFWNF
jgi:hypothetical protein